MPKAIDMHIHLPTPEFLEVTLGPYKAATEKFFRTKVALKKIEEMAQEYHDMDLVGVVLAWDAETATGLAPLSNDTVADIARRYPDTFAGFASVDPWKGKRAIYEIERAVKELGLVGAKFHPGVQAFLPSDRQFYPLYSKIAELGIPALFHTGTSGLGAGTPGGMGIKLDYSRPIHLDTIAADFPELTIIGAHPSWPWHEEMIAICQHKTNVYNDLSGWSPKYIPESLLREAGTRLQDKILFGSDYPFIKPERWLRDFNALQMGYTPEVRQKILYRNAQQLLAHSPLAHLTYSE